MLLTLRGTQQRDTRESSQTIGERPINYSEEIQARRYLYQREIAPSGPSRADEAVILYEEPEDLQEEQNHHGGFMRLAEESWKSQNLLTFGTWNFDPM